MATRAWHAEFWISNAHVRESDREAIHDLNQARVRSFETFDRCLQSLERARGLVRFALAANHLMHGRIGKTSNAFRFLTVSRGERCHLSLQFREQLEKFFSRLRGQVLRFL